MLRDRKNGIKEYVDLGINTMPRLVDPYILKGCHEITLYRREKGDIDADLGAAIGHQRRSGKGAHRDIDRLLADRIQSILTSKREAANETVRHRSICAEIYYLPPVITHDLDKVGVFIQGDDVGAASID